MFSVLAYYNSAFHLFLFGAGVKKLSKEFKCEQIMSYIAFVALIRDPNDLTPGPLNLDELTFDLSLAFTLYIPYKKVRLDQNKLV